MAPASSSRCARLLTATASSSLADGFQARFVLELLEADRPGCVRDRPGGTATTTPHTGLALRRVVKWGLQGVGSRPYKVIWRGAPPVGFRRAGASGRLPMGGYVLFGLLAGLSAALGFLVPPRSRVTAVH